MKTVYYKYICAKFYNRFQALNGSLNSEAVGYSVSISYN